jgi:hypothetical protein
MVKWVLDGQDFLLWAECAFTALSIVYSVADCMVLYPLWPPVFQNIINRKTLSYSGFEQKFQQKEITIITGV